MLDRSDPLAQLLAQDRRYRLEAYVFVFEALGYAHTVMGLGAEKPSEPLPPGPVKGVRPRALAPK